MCQTLDFNGEMDCLKDYVYRFEIADGCLPPSAGVSAIRFSTNDRVAFLRQGDWGCAMVINISVQHTKVSVRSHWALTANFTQYAS